MIDLMLQYKLFLIPIIVIFCAQMMKFARLSYKYEFKWDNIFDPGHFPSAHSAFVTSLVVVIGYYENITSGVFAVAACFAFITIYDAMRVRMQIGIQGKTLNRLVKEIDDIDSKTFPRLKEHVGHFANEVAGGIGVGIILSITLIWIIEFYL
ncbi:MAG: hypothetical protein CR972_04005 [Candidatus Moraniibacteriota bacterium]|nr:MAG: hypothetical protein CR972_04005 [Candidatus Moranbacteria bacterium]